MYCNYCANGKICICTGTTKPVDQAQSCYISCTVHFCDEKACLFAVPGRCTLGVITFIPVLIQGQIQPQVQGTVHFYHSSLHPIHPSPHPGPNITSGIEKRFIPTTRHFIPIFSFLPILMPGHIQPWVNSTVHAALVTSPPIFLFIPAIVQSQIKPWVYITHPLPSPHSLHPLFNHSIPLRRPNTILSMQYISHPYPSSKTSYVIIQPQIPQILFVNQCLVQAQINSTHSSHNIF